MKIQKFNEFILESNETQEDKELREIERFVKKSTEQYNDWDWDGEILTIFTDDGVEKYTRKDLEEEKIID